MLNPKRVYGHAKLPQALLAKSRLEWHPRLPLHSRSTSVAATQLATLNLKTLKP